MGRIIIVGKSAAANWAGRWARGGRPDPLIGNSVPDRSSGRSINIGDTVSYGDNFGTGKVTHILKNSSGTKYKVDNKYWDKQGVKKTPKKKGK